MLRTFIILAALLLVIVLACAAIYKMAFYSNKQIFPGPNLYPEESQYGKFAAPVCENMRWLEERSSERVEITARDGLKLRGSYYKGEPGKPVAIMFHGFRSAALRDMSGGAPYMIKRGYGVLLVDQRAHGESDGHVISFGVKERLDCHDWVDYVIGREGEDVSVILVGVSMGAGTVLMSADTDLPANVKGIIADCPYSSPMDIICSVGKSMKMPAGLAKPFIKLSAKLFGGFDICESSAVEAVKQLKIPALLIHGADDTFVPCEMSRRIAAANPEYCRLVEVEGAGHAMSYYVDTELYQNTLDEFLAMTVGDQ